MDVSVYYQCNNGGSQSHELDLNNGGQLMLMCEETPRTESRYKNVNKEPVSMLTETKAHVTHLTVDVKEKVWL